MTFPVEGQKQDAVPAKLEWVTPKFLPLLGEKTDGTGKNYVGGELRPTLVATGPS